MDSDIDKIISLMGKSNYGKNQKEKMEESILEDSGKELEAYGDLEKCD